MNVLKQAVEWIGALLYAGYLKAFQPGPRRIVLYYHSIREEDLPFFARQMEYTAKTCQVVRACEILSASPAGEKNLVSITFDDAFVSVRDLAIPVLERLGLTASVFVPVGILGQKPDWSLLEQTGDQEETVMDAEDLKSLQQSGFDFYSHTLSHPFLTRIEVSKMKEELGESRRRLGAILDRDVEAVSYPHGDYNPAVLEEAHRAGYTRGFTIEPQMVNAVTNPLAIGRFSVSPSEGLLSFRLKVIGAYQVSYWLRKIKKRLLGHGNS